MIDIVKEVTGLKNAYRRTRGAGPSGAPQTTWGDVIVVSSHLNKYLGAPSYSFEWEDLYNPLSISQRKFQETTSYKRARAAFEAASPIQRYGLVALAQNMGKKTIYPGNAAFWDAAIKYSIARSAAGVVKSWSAIAIESVEEAARELPGRMGDALKKMDPRNYVPDISGLASAIKWGSISGGLFILYWYVLRKK